MKQLKFKPIPPAWLERMTAPARKQVVAANNPAAPSAFATPGRRNADLASLAGFMRARGLDETQIAAGLAGVNATLAEPLPEGEAAAVARSISGYAAGFAVASDDVGLSRQIAERLKGRFRVIGEKGWLTWTGTHWDATEGRISAQEAIKEILEEFQDGILASTGERPRGLCSGQRVSAMLKLTVSDPALQIGREKLDADPNLLNLVNGILNLRTGELEPHRAEALQTKTGGVAFDPDATCPEFDLFLETIQPDPQTRSFLWRLLGYCMTGEPLEHRFVIFNGAGRNGKSTLVEAIAGVMGDFARTAEPSTFLAQRSEKVRTDLARLAGVRLVSTSELNVGERLDASLVKRMTGGERIVARDLYMPEFEYYPQFTPIMSTNALPIVDGGDSALVRRLLIVPFDTVISESEVDPRLPSKLAKERAGILNRLLEGLRDYRRMGLAVPPAVRDASKAFAEKSDLIATFIADCLVRDEAGEVQPTPLYDAYRVWCLENGLSPMSYRWFPEQIARRIGDCRKGTAGRRYYPGWRLLGQR